MHKRGLSFYLFVIFIISSSLCFPTTTFGNKSLIFAVHPYLPATELVNRFTPLVNYLSREMGQPIEMRVSKTYKDHIDVTGENRVDFAYIGSAGYVKMVNLYGRKPLLARIQVNGKSTYQGVIIVRTDRDLIMPTDLIGKLFAFGDPNSTSSYLVPLFVLWKAGVSLEDLGSYEFLKNHHNVALGVLTGHFDAGAVKEEVFYEYEERGLKELVRTPPISEYLFVATHSLPPGQVRKLRKTLYALANNEQGQFVMTSIKHSLTGMVPVKDEDYDNLRDILKTLEKIGVQ